MSYATLTDIQSEFKNITFDATSAISSTEIPLFIAQEEAVIDATISNRYEIPITGTAAILIMRKISIAYVAYRVAKILNLKKDVPIPEKYNPQFLNEGSAYLEAKKQLEAIQSGRIVLIDAVARSSSHGVKSYNSTNGILSNWERDIKQW